MLAQVLGSTELEPQAHLLGSLCTLKTWSGALNYASYIHALRNLWVPPQCLQLMAN